MTTSETLSFLAVGLSIIAILFTWGKYNLSAYGIWLKEINPTPQVFITKGEVKFRDYKDVKKGMIKTKEFEISAFIANGGKGSANHPKWTWRLNIKNRRLPHGDIYKEVIIRDKTNAWMQSEGYYPYLRAESSSYPICQSTGYNFELDDLIERKSIGTLEIRVIYYGKKNTEWCSYRNFKLIDGRWVSIKPTKVTLLSKPEIKRWREFWRTHKL